MLEHLPQEYREAMARPGALRGRSRAPRLRLHIDGATFPILRIWDDGFAVAAALLPRLRGAVEIRDGRRRVWTCLIVATEIEAGELRCSFKRLSPAQDAAPADYVRGKGAGRG
jgi:hypothetical protein